MNRQFRYVFGTILDNIVIKRNVPSHGFNYRYYCIRSMSSNYSQLDSRLYIISSTRISSPFLNRLLVFILLLCHIQYTVFRQLLSNKICNTDNIIFSTNKKTNWQYQISKLKLEFFNFYRSLPTKRYGELITKPILNPEKN